MKLLLLWLRQLHRQLQLLQLHLLPQKKLQLMKLLWLLLRPRLLLTPRQPLQKLLRLLLRLLLRERPLRRPLLLRLLRLLLRLMMHH